VLVELNLGPLVIPTLAFSGVYALAFAGGLHKLDRVKGLAGTLAFVALILALFAGAVWYGILVLLLAHAISPSLAIGLIVTLAIGLIVVTLAVLRVLSPRR
jgi:hypothetical protein